jgi:hypothetical protein
MAVSERRSFERIFDQLSPEIEDMKSPTYLAGFVVNAWRRCIYSGMRRSLAAGSKILLILPAAVALNKPC